MGSPKRIETVMEADGEKDWPRWSREAVENMQSRIRAFVEKFALSGRAFRWDLV